MADDPNLTRTSPPPDDGTFTFDARLDAGIAAAFATDATPGGWSQPPLLRDDPSDYSPVVRPDSTEMPRGDPSRYQLLGEIARGGMGVVFKGRDPDLGRDLAVKVLRTDQAGKPSAVQRFMEEAQVGGQLQHPGIVPVYDIGWLPDGRPYFAMKLVKGRTLSDLLTDRPNPTHDRVKYLQDFLRVCEAVGFAHSRGVIHRDLKPANVMVGSFGEVLVMDWGLAKVLPRGGVADEERASQANGARQPAVTEEPTIIQTARSGSGSGSETQAGSVMGTPAFMPPEQAGGEIDKLDERADVFGLGAMLCVILTGKSPYMADGPEAVRLMAIRGKLTDAFTRLDESGADAELIDLCKRCLAAERDARPRHAGEVAASVTSYLARVEQRAHAAEVERAAAAAEVREQWKRRKVQAALGLAFTALIVLGGAFAWWAREQRLAGEAEARDRQVAADREVNRAVEDAVAAFGRAVRSRSDLTLLAEARAAARQAEARAEETAAPSEVRAKVHALVAEIERTEKNRRLVADLLEVYAGRGDELIPTGGQDFPGADARYEQAFREYGADLTIMSPEAGAELLRGLGSDVKVELAAAIDDWAYVRALARKDEKLAHHFFQVTRHLDPDPVRNMIRRHLLNRDIETLHLLAAEVDPAAQPVQTVNLVAVAMSWMEGQVEAPRRFLRKAYPHHPGDFQITHNLAWFLIQQGLFADALPFSTAAIAIRPQSSAAWADYANALTGMGRDTEAVSAHRRVYALSPRNLTSRFMVIELLTKTGDRAGAEAAQAELDKLPKSPPTLVGVYWTLSRTRTTLGDRAGAVAAAREAVRLDPTSSKTHWNLAWALWLRNELAEAEAEARESIRLDPTDASGYDTLSRILRARRDLDGAEKACREAIRLKTTSSNFHTYLGILLHQRRDFSGAIASYRDAIRHGAGDMFTHNALALLYAAGPDGLRDGKRAVELATRACEFSDWRSGRYIDTLAAAYAEAGEFDKAIEYQKKALALPVFEKIEGNGYRARMALYERKQPYRDPAFGPLELAPAPRAVK